MTKKIEKDSKYGWFVVASSFTMLFVQVPTFHSEVPTFVQAPTFCSGTYVSFRYLFLFRYTLFGWCQLW